MEEGLSNGDHCLAIKTLIDINFKQGRGERSAYPGGKNDY
jgi:hypothetical protein